MKLEEILQLIKSVQQFDIQELEVANENWKIRITRQASQTALPQVVVEPPAAPPVLNSPVADPKARQEEAEASSNHQYQEIISPMVGTFYRASAPDADPFVQVNDTVSHEQTVCIIEAMKLMNEIPAESTGRIVEILVENAQPVEYGQPLFLIEPV